MRSVIARRSGDGGQTLPLVLALLIVAAVVLLALVPLARAGQQRAAARTAADAAALAGAAEGEEAARAVAALNGAELVEWHAGGRDVWVVVVLGDAQAEAKARREG